MIDRSFIGTRSEKRTVEVEKGQIGFFARTIGEENPIYFDEAAAQDAGYAAIPAPPTFGFSLKLLAPQKKGGIEDLGVDIGRVLHGEEILTYHAPIVAGDTITLETVVSDIYDKKGGAMEFIVQDTTAHNQNGVLVQESRTIIVVRNG